MRMIYGGQVDSQDYHKVFNGVGEWMSEWVGMWVGGWVVVEW